MILEFYYDKVKIYCGRKGCYDLIGYTRSETFLLQKEDGSFNQSIIDFISEPYNCDEMMMEVYSNDRGESSIFKIKNDPEMFKKIITTEFFNDLMEIKTYEIDDSRFESITDKVSINSDYILLKKNRPIAFPVDNTGRYSIFKNIVAIFCYDEVWLIDKDTLEYKCNSTNY